MLHVANIRNDSKINPTIWLVLSPFFYVAKPLNRTAIRSFGALKKGKIPAPYSRLYFAIVLKDFTCHLQVAAAVEVRHHHGDGGQHPAGREVGAHACRRAAGLRPFFSSHRL